MNILILGIGNILFQDEGIGAHFVHYIDEKYEFVSKENSVDIIDGGTLAQRLIPLIIKYDEVVVVDCIDANNASAGEVYFFNFEKIPDTLNWQGSAHEVEMLQTLNMIQMNDDLPTTNVIGVIPKRLVDDTTFELSDEIISATNTMENTIKKHLKTLNVDMIRKDTDITIQEMAQISYKREMINDTSI